MAVAPQRAQTSLAVAFQGETLDPAIAGKRSDMIREVIDGLVEVI